MWVNSAGADHPMVALTLDKLAVFYREQERFREALAAADQAIAIRALFLAKGLSQEATARQAQGEKREAEQLFRRALVVLDPSRPEQEKFRQQIESILAELTGKPGKPRRKQP